MFVHLHVRSWFSFLAGGSSPEQLVKRAANMGAPALALTDRNGVYGAVRFQKLCREHNIKPIFGAEMVVDNAPLVLLATSRSGYQQLNQLLTRAHFNDQDHPAVPFDKLAATSHDLICLTGGREGKLWQLVAQNRRSQARDWLNQLEDIYGDRLFVELSHHLRPGDNGMVEKLHTLARQNNHRTVATGDVRHAYPFEYKRYDLLTCIRLGQTVFDEHPARPYNDQAYLKSRTELQKLIPYPRAFENAAAIARTCNVDLLPDHITPPKSRTPDDRSAATHLRNLCQRQLKKRYASSRRRQAQRQLKKELSVIVDLGLSDYFLVVHEVIEEAQRRNIRCAGRGSAANSLVAYLLDITAVDPIAHNLLFERFLHGGRKKTPDIDIDFDAERRDEIITWMEERFGPEQTAMTTTLITYRLRSALRDTAKALGWPLHLIDKLTSAVPRGQAGNVRDHTRNIRHVLGDSPLLNKLIGMVEALEGCPRHLGLHNGGMVLSNRALSQFTPIQISANGVKMVQFDKDDIEALGLVKLDVLGLRMFASISETVELIHRYQDPSFDVENLPLDDVPTFNMIRASKTLGVFQIESQGQLHLLAQHQPENFYDLITDIALFRPGPVQGNMVEPFIRRRQGRDPITYDHPELKPILKDTYGIILFQEQILEIAHQFAGMPLMEADDFREVISKSRDPEKMEKLREQFVNGAVNRGIARETATTVYEKIAHFVGYGFCRSHAAAFAKTVYQSAYLKKHYPAAFMAAIMQHEPGMYSQMTLEEEAKRLNIPIFQPHIHHSGIRYDLEPVTDDRDTEREWAIRKPLTSVAHLSGEAARSLIWKRLHQPFESVEDLYRRTDLQQDALEALARSGALDELAGSSRRALWELGVLAQRLGSRTPEEKQPKLFEQPAVTEADIPDLPSLSLRERLSWDYETHDAARIHPMTLVRRSLNELEIRPIETCYRISADTLRTSRSPNMTITTAGITILRQRPSSANGVIFVTLEDETGFIQCVVPPKQQQHLNHELTQPALIVKGRLEIDGNWRGLLLQNAWTLNDVFGGYVGYPSSSGGRDRFISRAPAEKRTSSQN